MSPDANASFHAEGAVSVRDGCGPVGDHEAGAPEREMREMREMREQCVGLLIDYNVERWRWHQ